MDLKTLLSFQWSLMTPEFIITGAAILLSLLDLFAKKTFNRTILGYGALAAVAAALVSLVTLYSHEAGEILGGSFVLDGYAKAFKTLILLGGALVLLLAVSNHKQTPIRDKGEYYYLLLTGLLGAMFVTSSQDLIMLFVGLELLTLSSYVLVGIRKDNRKANEAAMKYVINGGIATAVTVFGLSYIYGLTGSTNVLEINAALQQNAGNSGVELLLMLAFLLTFVGLSFKLAAAPFHMWAPDVYQGAATPVTAFLGTVSKVAGFALVVRLFLFIFASVPAHGGTGMILTNVQQYIAVLAGITMVVGNFVALKQTNVKRMFAYSGIAHAGYLLVPFVALSDFTFDSMFFYMLAYILMNIGAFAVVHALSKDNDNENLSMFAGLFQRSPLTAVLMTVFILSLAGIPGTAGFIGKVNIFLGAFALSHYVLPSIMMATTVVSFVYYFRILQQMFFRSGEETKVVVPASLRAAMLICAILTVVLGILPSLGYNLFYDQLVAVKDFLFTGAN
ncbi:NADH-quinone oxidoreductase subunit NuoN [Ectobacillus ponti]|uniref:NADH-quinone oxidoreductase subunit N n=1 Tax=Ectobacillus ponti TaxID=2961894 RepID=A0AA41X7R9_9BACI|nr:NADH-quinone oxidoreductase subunit NuoN [Ectobacillus ponti]MCP8967890.1 NADH-quinone oxidoreductase subunit NuoN [Ectobacillus ponti]